jgi:DNA-binding winged helix-turn-helix (wHTH) protein
VLPLHRERERGALPYRAEGNLKVPPNREPADSLDPPVIDADGLLRFDGRWVAVSETQLPVVELLVARFGELVSNDAVLAAYGTGGGTTTRTALRPLVHRLRQRLDPIGLTLHVVRRRGVVLDAAAGDLRP